MSETGRAAVFAGNREPFTLRSFPVPDPREGDLIVRVTRANVCGSDLHIWRGDTDVRAMGIPHGIILGHEMTGRVAKLGARVNADAYGRPLKEGDRVVFTYYLHCGHCRACARGDHHVCMMSIGSVLRSCDKAPHFFGGFADYYYVKGAQRVFKVPDTVSDAAVAGANCALSQVIHGFDEVGLRLGDRVVVQGAGGLGVLACAVAKEAGAELVVAIDSIPARLAMARRFGADAVIDMAAVPDGRERVNQVLSMTDGWGADVVVEVAGVPEAVSEGVRMLGRGGRYLELGNINPRHTYKADPSLLTGFNRSMHGVSLYPATALARAVDFLARARERYPFDDLVSHVFPLESITEAFERSDPHGTDKPAITRAAIAME